MKQRKTRKAFDVIVAVRMYNAVGRTRLEGILRFLRHGRNWRIKLIETEDRFTAQTIAGAIKDGIDGFIVFQSLSPNIWRDLIDSRIPIVSLESVCPPMATRGRLLHLVRVDDEGIGALAARHLLNAGDFRTFGFIPSPQDENWSRRRLAGFAAEIRANKKECRVFTPPKDGARDNASALVEWVSALPQPAALFAANDLVATHAIAALHAANLDIPRQVAILGVDNDEILCQNVEPSLTSIRFVTEKEGELVASELEKMMTGASSRKDLIPWNFKEIVRRESTSFTTPAAQLIRRALQYVNRHAAEGVRVRDVVRHLGVSQRLLELRFRELEGKSVAQALDDRRFVELVRLLKDTDAPISQIAADCGFGNLSNLTRRFRKRYGKTMREWRREMRGK